MNGGTLGTGVGTISAGTVFGGLINGSGNFSVAGAVLTGTGGYTGTVSFVGTAATISSQTAVSRRWEALTCPQAWSPSRPISNRLLLTIDGGTVTLTTGGSVNQFSLDRGMLVLPFDVSVNGLLTSTSSGGLINITATGFTSGGTSVIDFSAVSPGGSVSLGSTAKGSIAARHFTHSRQPDTYAAIWRRWNDRHTDGERNHRRHRGNADAGRSHKSIAYDFRNRQLV